MKNTKIVNIVILLIFLTCFSVAGTLDYYRGEEKRIVKGHRKEHHPVINALFARDIRQGQTLETLLNSWSPSRYSRHHNFTTLYYVKGDEEPEPCCGDYSIYIRVIAEEDKLVKALAVEGVLSEIEYVFFNSLDESTEDAYWTSRLQSATAKR